MAFRRMLLGATLCVAIFAGGAGAAEMTKLTLKVGGGEIVVQQIEEKKWTATEGGKTFTLGIADGGTVVYWEGADEIARGTMKGGKLLMAADGETAMVLSIRADKIKVTLAEGGDPWEIKFRDDKVKLVRSEKELGKVKYYPDTGKLKAKDAAEKTIVEVRGAGKLVAGPIAFLIEGLDPGRRNFIMLLLFALGR